MTAVGRNIPHDAAEGHVSGESIYIDDMPFAKNELIVDFLGSPHAHAKLISIHAEPARTIPGIVGLYTAADLNGHNQFGPIIQDEVLLVAPGQIASFIGHPIVVIAAENRQAIAHAKKLIELQMEPLPPIFTIDEAKAQSSYISTPRTIERGDVENALKNAEHVLEGTFTNGGQEHFYLESQACLAIPGEFNSITVHSSTQHPTEVQHVIAEVLGLQQKDVVCITKRMGGAFGGKESQATHPAVMAALVAFKTKRPARMVLDKDTDMHTTGKRHPFQNDYRVGFTKEGLITGLSIDLFTDGGAAADLSTAVLGRAMCHAENAYYIPHVRITGTICKTNFPPNTAFRGFGGPQGMINMENILETIAAYLQKDPYEVRRRNLYGTTDRNVTPYGQTVQNNMLPELMDRLCQEADYKKRLAAVETFNATSQTHLKGISLTPMKFGISFNTKFLNQANALVNVYVDGTVQVSTGGTEMGQGLNTKIRQLVADEFAIDPADVVIMPTSTEKNNNTSATAASSGTDLNGSAAVDACQKIRARLSEYAATLLDAGSAADIIWEDGHLYNQQKPEQTISFKTLIPKAYRERINMGERGFYATQGIHFNVNTNQGSPFLYFTTGCAVSEVLIDRFTGELKILRADLLMDIGKSINPGIDRGQITGGFIQGMGWLTTEELKYSADGTLLSHSPTTYKIPNIQDVPEIFNIDWVENDRNEVNLKRSKAVGEPPFMLAISVWTAVKHALNFAGAGSPLKVPATNEEILMRLSEAQQFQKSGKTCREPQPISKPLP